MQKTILIIGAVTVIVGLLWPWLSQLPIGRLPGDIVIRKENYTFYFPVTSMILVSVILNLLLRVFKQ